MIIFILVFSLLLHGATTAPTQTIPYSKLRQLPTYKQISLTSCTIQGHSYVTSNIGYTSLSGSRYRIPPDQEVYDHCTEKCSAAVGCMGVQPIIQNNSTSYYSMYDCRAYIVVDQLPTDAKEAIETAVANGVHVLRYDMPGIIQNYFYIPLDFDSNSTLGHYFLYDTRFQKPAYTDIHGVCFENVARTFNLDESPEDESPEDEYVPETDPKGITWIGITGYTVAIVPLIPYVRTLRHHTWTRVGQ
jgi:hypothetical protein